VSEEKVYAGFTIGPIYDVLSNSKKTRELWFASYFFSWFMEKMAQKLFENDNVNFITPFLDKNKPFRENYSKIGIYHDRFVIESSKFDKKSLFKKINKASDETMDFFVELIDNLRNSLHIKYSHNESKKTVKNILENYIQRNFVVLESSHIEENSIVGSVDKYLNSMEENRSFNIGVSENTCFRCKTLPGVIERKITEEGGKSNLCPICFMKFCCYKSKCIENKTNIFSTPSTLHIAAAELLLDTDIKKALYPKTDEEIEQREYDIQEIETFTKVKRYHKYFAVVTADGDNLGKLAGNLDRPEELSERLLYFAEAAKDIVEDFKGKAIYIGGDDLLAFMPVAFRDGDSLKSVFDFATKLSDKYRDIVDKGEGKTSISVGVNIAYYKFPLSRALDNAYKQLNIEAKKDKNTLAIMLTKHSGQKNEFSFKFNSYDIESFENIFRKIFLEKIELPHSIHHNLYRYIKLMAAIEDKRQFTYFFENNFNEAEHKICQEGIDLVRDMLKNSIDFSKGEKEIEKNIENILQKLKFIKFLRGDKADA